MISAPPPVKDAQIEIARLDKLLSTNRAILMNPGEADVPKVKARIDELLDERIVWMKVRDANKPKRRARKATKKGVAIPVDTDL